MKIYQLIELLEAEPDKDLEVVFRVGINHGAKRVTKVHKWNAYENPNHTRSYDPAHYLLPDNPNHKDAETVLVLCG